MEKKSNLVPIPKGVSGNPNGRPVGKKSRSTLLKKWLEVSETIENPLTAQIEQLTQEDLMVLAMIRKAIGGDVNAFKAVMDGRYGLQVQETKNENKTIDFRDIVIEIEGIKPDQNKH